MSHRFCLKVTKFHSTSLSSFRAMEKSSVGGGHRPDRVKMRYRVRSTEGVKN